MSRVYSLLLLLVHLHDQSISSVYSYIILYVLYDDVCMYVQDFTNKISFLFLFCSNKDVPKVWEQRIKIYSLHLLS